MKQHIFTKGGVLLALVFSSGTQDLIGKSKVPVSKQKNKVLTLLCFLLFLCINLANAQWLTNGTTPYLSSGSKAGIGLASPTHAMHIRDGSLMLDNNPSVNGNNGLIFRNYSSTTSTWGDWGIQYYNGGINFWKPYGNSSGYSADFLLFLKDNGNVGIGVGSPAYKLDVCGTIRSKEVRVETGWCDYVFEPTYKLPSLNVVEAFISEYKHLPEIPSEKEIVAEGLKLGEMQALHMKKIEELTLYLIQLNKENEDLKKRVEKLESGQK
jgi:hypothetical protein